MGLSLKAIVLGVTLVMSMLFFVSLADAVNPAKSSIVDDFCNQRKTTSDKAFCIRAMKSSPASVSAKDNPALLKIAIKLAVSNAKKTRHFINKKAKSETRKPSVKNALQDCVLAYNGSIKQLDLVIQDLNDDPPMVSYDVRMARKELNKCRETLAKKKIADDSITSRNRIAIQYARLYEDLSNSI